MAQHQDLIDRLAATPKRLAQLVVEATDELLDAAAPGEWPARTVLAHLRDEESLVFRLRLERLLAEDEPEFASFPPEHWEARRNRARDRKDVLLADLALQRQASLNLLHHLRPEEWDRRGRHHGQAAITVHGWVEYWARHDAEHFAQIERALGETVDEVLERRARMVEQHRDHAR